MTEVGEIYNTLVERGIATEDELNLITDINGYSVETLNDVIYARTGCRCIEDFLSE